MPPGWPVHAEGRLTLDRLGPGTVLGGRYVLRSRLDDAEQASAWQAHDETLQRRVYLRAVLAEHLHAERLLDAARQAAAVEDPRLVRVLDVGQDDGVTYVVSEWLAAPTLAEQLRTGPLTADLARSVVGEAALGLETARHRGLHHLRLTPERVHVLDDGAVKITELATAAALDGVEVGDGGLASEEATRQDTRDLVALAYAALTATWPLATPSELPDAPRIAGKPVAPNQIVTGAPADLDTICAQTFAGAGPPDSPGELAGQIAPWGRKRHDERAGGAFPHALPPSKRTALPTATPPAQTLETMAAPGVRIPVEADQPRTAEPEPKPEPTPEPTVEPEPPVEREQHPRHTHLHLPSRPPDPHVPVTLAQLGVGGTAEYPRDTSTPSWADSPPDRQREDPTRLFTEEDHATADRRQSRTALTLVAAFVATFLLLAYCGLRGLGDNAFVPSGGATTKDSPSPSASTGSPTSPSASTTPTPSAPPAAVSITAARGFDPQGDQSEKDDIAARAFDGKPSTQWTSDTYKSEPFGGLKKGVGLLLELGGEHQVSAVTVTVGAGGATIELRTADGSALTDTVYATQRDAAGTITLRPSKPIETDNVVLWFTKPAQVDGGYRAEVAEVSVS